MPQYRIIDDKQAVEATTEHARDEQADQWFTGWVLEGGPSRGTRPHHLERQDGSSWTNVASWVVAE
ncbi:hypothetical protein [Aeromicrobium sp. IC_218]|uniref:hypothetical protein n=1 Tax=Aeromicrobium sp. IC_218 TaxID=2545468 RepID=UPI00103C9861|nr:hypothetical protein [Aeromicrobium sp. IC_218]TCJ00700.1 hypothetical protein E0W78_01010 [Aeromicrobium sp. IC_218]